MARVKYYFIITVFFTFKKMINTHIFTYKRVYVKYIRTIKRIRIKSLPVDSSLRLGNRTLPDRSDPGFAFKEYICCQTSNLYARVQMSLDAQSPC